ncbi:hypothetical protein N3K66_006323 [Trichothecium roseum]|uniref:Uncharacterized protein n=1 Tax=Trichothecium roseum TaxID=47278 RepID=A0ACC0UXL2_9HYPO|nr:hypothetical protein N3K66_006323 [Trichothecium roseum]
MIYNQGNQAPVPSLDILTWLFESEHCLADEDAVVHAEADHPEQPITKARARQLTKQIAHFLRHTYGIGSTIGSTTTTTNNDATPDVVVSISTGQSALATLFFAVVAAGGCYSACSHTSTPSDVARQIRDGPSRLVVCSRDVRDRAVRAAADAGLPARNVLVLESYPRVRLYSADGGSVECAFDGSLEWERVVDPERLRRSKVCILYSSGTTGLPKGVLISHTNIVAEATLTQIPARAEYARLRQLGRGYTQRTLAHLPASHVAGLMGYFVLPLYDGGAVYWLPTFDLSRFLAGCRALRVNSLFSVPPVWGAVAKHPAVGDSLRHVRKATAGAAPLGAEIQRQASARVGDAGCAVSQVYGLSETTGCVSTTPDGDEVVMGSLGSLLPNVTMRLVDDEGRDVEPGEPGEAYFKGPIVTQGYHNNAQANRDAFTPDGWLKTGDVLRVHEGQLYVVDRKKELIKYKGLQVAPAELEALLLTNPSISDAAVIGVPWQGTEAPRAYVVRSPSSPSSSPSSSLTEASVQEFVASRVAPHKKLRGGVRFVDSVPRSAAGKILRKELREMRRREEDKAAKL